MPKAKKKSSKKAPKSNSRKTQNNNPKNQTQHIRKEFEEILKKEYPKSVTFNDLGDMVDFNCRKVGGKYKKNSITAQFANVVRNKPDEFGKHRDTDLASMVYYYRGEEQKPVSDDSSSTKRIVLSKNNEEDYYESFASFLCAQKDQEVGLSECTKAVAWGGSKSGEKWGTPDVVGIFRPKSNSEIKFLNDIVSAEIKVSDSSSALITAFGQACVYRLFSHKVYLVVPQSGQNYRLKSLCHLYGLGLVYFDPTKKSIDPSIYKVQLLARRHSPDTSYVNNFIKKELATKLNINIR